MRICIDGRWITERPSGIGVYALEMISRLPKLAPPSWEFCALFRSEAVLEYARRRVGLSAPNLSFRIVPYGPFSLKSQFLLPRYLRSLSVDLFHSPSFLLPYLGMGGCKMVANVHDIIPLVVEDYAPSSKTSKFRWLYRAIIRRTVLSSSAIITGSECSKRDIVHNLRLSGDKIRVIFDGASLRALRGEPSVIKRDGNTSRTIIYVGRMDPYKNVPLLVRAFAKIRERVDFPLELVIVGSPDVRYPESGRIAEELGVTECVHFTGFVSQEELERIYHDADLLIHPSRYEGFGLQIIEAMDAGTPVVCTDGGSQPEVAGDAAVVVPVNDLDAMVQAAVGILQSPSEQLRLRELGYVRARLFTWDKTARETLSLYSELLEGGRTDG